MLIPTIMLLFPAFDAQNPGHVDNTDKMVCPGIPIKWFVREYRLGIPMGEVPGKYF